MKLVFQISCGILLALLVVFLVQIVPRVFDQHREEVAEESLIGLTPGLAIERCGTPLRDESDGSSGLRSLYFKSPEVAVHFAHLTFISGNGSDGSLVSVEGASAGSALDGVAGWKAYDRADRRLALLPCLAKRRN